MALACTLALGSVATACGGSSTSTGSSTPAELVVKAPDVALQGCTYVLDGTVPAGEPQGVQPNFSSFSPDTPATAALNTIKENGGYALANGFTLPGNTRLYAGPDTSQPAVGTIPSSYAILVAEPVVWTAKNGDTWVAFFISCGGQNLYWVNLAQVQHQNPEAASSIIPLVSKNSLVGIEISDQNFAWKKSNLTYIIGRGELYGPVA